MTRRRELAARLVAAGGSVSVHAGDVGDPAFCQGLVARLVAERGRVDYLVNNAGLLIESTVSSLPGLPVFRSRVDE